LFRGEKENTLLSIDHLEFKKISSIYFWFQNGQECQTE